MHRHNPIWRYSNVGSRSVYVVILFTLVLVALFRCPVTQRITGSGVGGNPGDNDAHTKAEDRSVRASTYGWFSGRASPAPQSVHHRDPSRPPPTPGDLKSEVERLRAEVSSLKASQSIETFKLIKSHQEKYEGVKKDVDTLRYKLEKLKEKAEPKTTVLGQLWGTVGWLFSAFDFLIKWSWRIFVIIILFRWWSSIRAWPSLPWQNW
ncbi:hypothetical protein AAMO2058_000119400 [Amorphochlora amoebiformis]|uniref:Uncharacterized protein n=1 Tax=Amorphochlora amoebiformis TaxID=1561963 RepID=A0A7S0H110_9EUKA|mmetsp:Transcript_25201/g.39821  ORF Transcript_25201/g.39821 Transcript_25201/m.39821 type:complete len:207 (+) Transcript_25201:52-672(+)